MAAVEFLLESTQSLIHPFPLAHPRASTFSAFERAWPRPAAAGLVTGIFKARPLLRISKPGLTQRSLDCVTDYGCFPAMR